MKFFLSLFCCLAAGMLVAAEAQPLLTFSAEQPKLEFHKPQEKEQGGSYTDLPDGRKGVRIDWNNAKSWYTEFIAVKRMPLPVFDVAEIFVDVYLPEGAPLKSFSIRLRDKQGEIHQFSQKLAPELSGWQRLKFTVDATQESKSCWGGGKNANKRLDFPASFIGFAADFNHKTGNGWMGLDAVLVNVVSAPVEPDTVTLLAFSAEQPKFSFHKPEEKEQSNTYTDLPDGRKGVRVDWNNAKSWYTEFAVGKSMRLPQFDVAEISVDVYLPAGAPLKGFNLRLRDTHGEFHQFNQKLAPELVGWQRLNFTIDVAQESKSTWGGGKNANKKLDFPLSISGFAADFNHKTGNGWIGMDTVTVKVVSAPAEIRLATGSGSPIAIVKPGEEDKLAIEIENHRPSVIHMPVDYKITDALGNPIAQKSETLEIGSRKVGRIALPAPTAYGVYYVTLNYRETPDSPVVTQAMQYGYMSPAGPTVEKSEGFIFGICTHLRGKPEEDQRREAMAAAWCGAKVARDDISFGRVMPTPESWNFDQYEVFRVMLEKQGVELAPILQFPPQWTKPEGWKSIRERGRGHFPPMDKPWREFCTRIAQELRGKVRYIEIWNEPDHPGFADFYGDEYVRLLNSAYESIKAVAPEMQVQTGGVSGLVSQEQKDLFQQTIKEGKYDIPAFHGHGSLGGYRPQVRALREMFKGSWYANETALSAMNIGEIPQAVALFQKFLYSWANGAMGYNWYDLRNDGTDPKNNEHNFGMITYDFQPKAIYVVYNMLANAYRGGEFIAPLSLPGTLEGYLFRAADGALLLACWDNDGSFGGRTVALSGISGKVTQIDLFGNEKELNVRNGQVVLQTAGLPVTLRFDGMKKAPEVKGELIALENSILITNGEKKEFTLLLSNPTNRALTFETKLNCPDKVTGSLEHDKVTVAPGKTEKLTGSLLSAPGFLSLEKSPAQITVTASANGLWEGELKFPVRNAVVLPPEGYTTQPNFILDNATQVTTLVVNAPDTAHLFWSGVEDLSGEIWLGRDGDTLLVKAEITDDVHCQPNTGAMTWAGDNIQMAMLLPGQSALWEIGLTHLADGKSEAFVWLAPAGFDAAGTAARIELKTGRDEARKLTTYEARIPFQAIGMTDAIGKRGFRFNLIVNDNDGERRESYIGIAPGIAETKTPQFYPSVRFR